MLKKFGVSEYLHGILHGFLNVVLSSRWAMLSVGLHCSPMIRLKAPSFVLYFKGTSAVFLYGFHPALLCRQKT